MKDKRKKEKEIATSPRKPSGGGGEGGKVQCQGGPGPPSSPLPSLSTSPPLSPSFLLLRAWGNTLPTRVSRRKVNTAGAARTSSKSSLTSLALGPSQSHSLSTLHRTRCCPLREGHRATRWKRVCLWPVSHSQHVSLSTVLSCEGRILCLRVRTGAGRNSQPAPSVCLPAACGVGLPSGGVCTAALRGHGR